MLYIVHFSYEGPETKPEHGSLACLAEADNVEACLEKCRKLIVDLNRRGDLGANLRHIYLDVAVQIRTVPETGVLTHMTTRPGYLAPSKSLSLPACQKEACEAFSLASDSEDQNGVDVEPFMTLG